MVAASGALSSGPRDPWLTNAGLPVTAFFTDRTGGIGVNSTPAPSALGRPTPLAPVFDMMEASDRTLAGCLMASSWAISAPCYMPACCWKAALYRMRVTL